MLLLLLLQVPNLILVNKFSRYYFGCFPAAAVAPPRRPGPGPLGTCALVRGGNLVFSLSSSSSSSVSWFIAARTTVPLPPSSQQLLQHLGHGTVRIWVDRGRSRRCRCWCYCRRSCCCRGGCGLTFGQGREGCCYGGRRCCHSG